MKYLLFLVDVILTRRFFLDQFNKLKHHPASPLLLARNNYLEHNLFDLIISGDGGYIIAQVGELVAHQCKNQEILKNARIKLINYVNTQVIGYVDG